VRLISCVTSYSPPVADGAVSCGHADGRATRMIDHRSAGARGRRPRAVSFVASLVLAEAVALLVLAGLGLFGMIALELRGPTLIVERVLADAPARSLSGIAAGGALAGLFLAIAGVGLLRMHAWAWSLAIVAHGAALVDALAGYVVGRPQYELMAVGSLIVLVLNQREVRQAFLPEYGGG